MRIQQEVCYTRTLRSKNRETYFVIGNLQDVLHWREQKRLRNPPDRMAGNRQKKGHKTALVRVKTYQQCSDTRRFKQEKTSFSVSATSFKVLSFHTMYGDRSVQKFGELVFLILIFLFLLHDFPLLISTPPPHVQL
jgi:hypothetical protein